MPDGIYEGGLVHHLEKFVGETVTIFTTSGGESGMGFTGVLLAVNHCYARLVTQIGPAPGCALGNSCDDNNRCDRNGYDRNNYRNGYVWNVGSITDIPIDRIASFVHNAV